jgi:hypothetical protein
MLLPLAHTPAFTAYAGVCLVPSPRMHPSYASLFDPDWALAVRERLRLFLEALKPRIAVRPPGADPRRGSLPLSVVQMGPSAQGGPPARRVSAGAAPYFNSGPAPMQPVPAVVAWPQPPVHPALTTPLVPPVPLSSAVPLEQGPTYPLASPWLPPGPQEVLPPPPPPPYPPPQTIVMPMGRPAPPGLIQTDPPEPPQPRKSDDMLSPQSTDLSVPPRRPSRSAPPPPDLVGSEPMSDGDSVRTLPNRVATPHGSEHAEKPHGGAAPVSWL